MAAQGGETTKPSPPAQDPAEADAWEVLVTQIGLGLLIFFASLSYGGSDARHVVSLPGAKTGRQAWARPPQLLTVGLSTNCPRFMRW